MSDISGAIPLRLPPLQEVNHRIELVDPNLPIKLISLSIEQEAYPARG